MKANAAMSNRPSGTPMPAPTATASDDEHLAGGMVVYLGKGEAEIALGLWVVDAAGEDDGAWDLAAVELGIVLCDETLLTDAPATNTNWPKPPEKGVL